MNGDDRTYLEGRFDGLLAELRTIREMIATACRERHEVVDARLAEVKNDCDDSIARAGDALDAHRRGDAQKAAKWDARTWLIVMLVLAALVNGVAAWLTK